MPAFRRGREQVRAPATSANLGPGFDALGLALDLHDDVYGQVADAGLAVEIAGEGATLPGDETHLVVRAMRAAFDRLGGQPPGLSLSCRNRIPHGRGLGSSAAAIVAGIVLARALVLDGDQLLPDHHALALAGELEGHPDNVAPALLGGATVAWQDRDGAHAVRLPVAPRLCPVALVPPFEASTELARGLLPDTVPHRDAAFTAGRAALLVAALSGATEHLLAATEDRLHQRYRAGAMPESAALVDRLRRDGLPAVVSGAGPTVLVLARAEPEVAQAAAHAPDGWRVVPLSVADQGAHVVAPAG